jgi:hypothetical protein
LSFHGYLRCENFNHSVANWKMNAILPFILPSPKRLLLVWSTVYPRNLRQSRNH